MYRNIKKILQCDKETRSPFAIIWQVMVLEEVPICVWSSTKDGVYVDTLENFEPFVSIKYICVIQSCRVPKCYLCNMLSCCYINSTLLLTVKMFHVSPY